MKKQVQVKIDEEISEPSNGGREAYERLIPYTVAVTLEGVSDILFHRWNPEAIDAKANADKNSKTKKTDDVESYVYRADNGDICIPGEYLRQSIIHAAKYKQDPRSPRKSAMDLFRAGIVSLTELAPVIANGVATKDWDYLDRRRAVVQRQGINRTRPAFKAGWNAKFEILTVLPEYITKNDLNELITNAGRFIGVADFRPTFGRYQITNFEQVC